MRFRFTVIPLVFVAMATGARATEQAAFDFHGWIYWGCCNSPILFAVITDNVGSNLPLPLDYSTIQYKFVAGGGALASTSGSTELYRDGQIAIWEDPIVGGQPASVGNTSSYLRSSVTLSGYMEGYLSRTMFDPNHGVFSGMFNFRFGRRIGELRVRDGWIMSGVINHADFYEYWDGTVFMTTVAIERKTWASVRQLYR